MSIKHDQLREVGIDWLQNQGFNDIEVKVKIPNHSGKNYKGGRGGEHLRKPYYAIDIVGRKEGKKVVMECGGSKSIKLDNLLGEFNEVWVLPYGEAEPFQWKMGMELCQNCGHIV